MRREWLDYLIPFNERHLRFVLKAWIAHFNSARPHMSLGPVIPSGLLAPVCSTTIVTVFLTITRFDASPFWADFITSTGSRRRLRNANANLLRTTPGESHGHSETDSLTTIAKVPDLQQFSVH
jgi:hypothetical protein